MGSFWYSHVGVAGIENVTHLTCDIHETTVLEAADMQNKKFPFIVLCGTILFDAFCLGV